MPPLADYPDSFGAHRFSVFAHTGPASYTQMTTGPLAGGDTVNAVEAGVKFLDAVIPVGLSDSGVYRVEAVAPVGNPSTNKQAAHATSWRLRWVVVSTGAEAAALLDLDGETVRLVAVARY
jgi:hypothetical protein